MRQGIKKKITALTITSAMVAATFRICGKESATK